MTTTMTTIMAITATAIRDGPKVVFCFPSSSPLLESFLLTEAHRWCLQDMTDRSVGNAWSSC
jgi:hypothetical protein